MSYEQPQNKATVERKPIQQKSNFSFATESLISESTQCETQTQRQAIANNSPQVGQLKVIQKMANTTGLPNQLKSGVESLSGFSMEDVKVHYNSSKPAQLHAYAYAQGTDIHLGTGQEKHLPHEAWHVVQQKQGRVKPTMQLMGKVNVNDDAGLEREADVMGAKAMNSTEANADDNVQRSIKPSEDQSVMVSRNSMDYDGPIQMLSDPNHDWKKVLDVYNTYHNDYIHFHGAAPPGGLGDWTKDAADAEARILSEWHGVKHLLHAGQTANFGWNDNNQPDAYASINGAGIHHAVEHKFVSGKWGQIAENVRGAIDQLAKDTRARYIRTSATAIITVKPDSEAARDLRLGQYGEWDQALSKGLRKLNKTHGTNPKPTLQLIVQIEGEPPLFSKTINQFGQIQVAAHAAPVVHSVSHDTASATNIALGTTYEGLASVHVNQGNFAAAMTAHNAAGAAYTAAGNNAAAYTSYGQAHRAQATIHMAQAAVHTAAGEHVAARAIHNSAGASYTFAGDLHSAAGGHVAARTAYESAGGAYAAAGDTTAANMSYGKALSALGEHHSSIGNHDFARQAHNSAGAAFTAASNITAANAAYGKAHAAAANAAF